MSEPRANPATARASTAPPDPAAARRTLVAGVGNIFLGDDGFGVEVARRMAERRRAQGPESDKPRSESQLPDGVEIADIGIRGVHLAFELLDGCGLLVLADAAARGEPPGTLTLLEVETGAGTDAGTETEAHDPNGYFDPHDLGPDALLSLLHSLGGRIGRIVVVACEPLTTEPGIGLSAPVAAAVDPAIELIARLVAGEPVTSPRPGQTASPAQ